MSIYLAWSVYKLVGTLVVWALVTALLFYLCPKYTPKVRKKAVAVLSVIYLTLIVFTGFNVGQRQTELDRPQFDATIPTQQQEAIKSQRRTIESVKETFESAVKKTQ